MNLKKSMLMFCVAALALTISCAIADAPKAITKTPLDEYVAKPDPAFSYDSRPARAPEHRMRALRPGFPCSCSVGACAGHPRAAHHPSP